MDAIRYKKYCEQERLKHLDEPCEQCGKEHDHTYGTGRFCSKSCRMSYITSQNKYSEKHKKHLEKLHKKNKVPYGTWKCEECNLIFETRAKLNEHLKLQHGRITKHSIKGKEKPFACPFCFKEFDTSRQLGGHMANCPKHPNKVLHDLGHKKAGKTFKQNYKDGKISFSKQSHKHTNKTKEHLSEVRAAQVQNEYLTNFHAKVKWYKVKNLNGDEYSVRGTWEVNVSKHLNDLGILWIKAKPIKYFKEYWHNYTADFYIPSLDVYVEVKGRYPDADREKMSLVCVQNPEKKIYFIHDKYFDFIDGKIPFDDNFLIQEKDL